MTGAPLGIVGAGAWGTALANAAAAAGAPVVLWTRDPDHAREMAQTRTNDRHLPGVPLADPVRPTSALTELSGCDALLLVVPAQAVREVTTALALVLPVHAPLVICAKGVERETGFFLSDVVADLRPGSPVGALSGPSFAHDVAIGLPTAVTLAAPDPLLAAGLAARLSGRTLRVYHALDLRGVEIGGAGKNVLAIACGAAIGRGLGESARAALTARGFSELMRFARAYGGRAETLMGLSGLGDVVLTCASPHSRNFAFGERLGRGVPVTEAAGGRLVEGAATADALVALARARGLEMPVCAAVAALVAGRAGLDETMDALMSRPLKAED
ncbi:NAD(P)H-dependent glycerol-3-phosphate dehydrogenase [Salinarimonas chemoclinalis]|uniref:NAD(P)H-dependent glycerol-3-phosphate dehydrogenase n=1 Tax=Salinarimonas chemoclinalis TaxID=3241599 RepID=UPI003557C06C